MANLVRESIFSGPSHEEILKTLREYEPPDQLKISVSKRYKKGVVDALKRGARIFDALRSDVVLNNFSSDEIKRIVEEDTGINFHVSHLQTSGVNVYLIPTFRILNNILDDMAQIIYEKSDKEEEYYEFHRIEKDYIRSFLVMSLLSSTIFQNDLRIKYKGQYYIERGTHLEVGLSYFSPSTLLDIDSEKIKDYILKEGEDYKANPKHFLLPLDVEKYVSVNKSKRNRLLEFHEDVQEIIDKYSDAEYWANKYMNFWL